MRRSLSFVLAIAALIAATPVLAAPEPAPSAQDVLLLVTDKLQQKYRAEVDRTCDRLWAKVKGFSPDDRGAILNAMRRSVDRKVGQVRALEGLETGRRKAILDLLDYVGRKLDALADRAP